MTANVDIVRKLKQLFIFYFNVNSYEHFGKSFKSLRYIKSYLERSTIYSLSKFEKEGEGQKILSIVAVKPWFTFIECIYVIANLYLERGWEEKNIS